MLLDGSTPKRLTTAFRSQVGTRTAQQMPWTGTANRELLRLPADHGSDALVMIDQAFEFQHNVTELPIQVVIMIAGRTRFQELLLFARSESCCWHAIASAESTVSRSEVVRCLGMEVGS